MPRFIFSTEGWKGFMGEVFFNHEVTKDMTPHSDNQMIFSSFTTEITAQHSRNPMNFSN
ncbi:MAG: hypothetical protein GX130_08860 [Candidatus Hydrogenedens sp.]|nr:hypothetical protein [Candidatus Hydrogenedens sp.]